MKRTGENGMILVDDLIIGVLSSAIVAYVDRLDDAIDEAQKERLEELKRRIEAMRNWDSSDEQATTLFNEALRDHRQPGSPAAALAKIVPYDPVWGMELAQWLLEPDPKQFASQQEDLAARLAKASDCEKGAVAEFLTRVSRRIDHHLGLSQLRADKKLNLILDRLRGFEELREIVERNQFTFLAAFRQWLTDEQRKVLIPVCPVARNRTERNSLLSGSRPTDNDMHENLDFERSVFKDVIAAIKAVDTFPCTFLFKAEPQKGKTTFLKRVGWHLAQHNYPVLQLAEGARGEPYANGIEDCAAEQTSLPLVVLIDDPANQGEHFTNQLEQLRQRGSRVVILLASRSLDWDQVKKDQCPLISDKHLRKFELNPRRGEERRLLEKLVSCDLLGVDRFDGVIKEVEEIPFGERYFHRVIEVATDQRNRPISAIVVEALREAAGSSEADAFERFYAVVCVPGMLGLPLPEWVAQIVFPDDAERARALAFNEKMLRPAIRISDPDYSATHEIYAAEFLAPRDIIAETRSFVEAFAARPELGDYVGRLLIVLHVRGFTETVEALWDEIADHVTDDHWRACSAAALTFDWGSLLYLLGRMRPSLRANAIAVEKAPEHAEAHGHYALLLGLLKEPEAARTHYEEALRIDPKYVWVHNNIGSIYRTLGQQDAALLEFQRALVLAEEAGADSVCAG
ncbi:MAG: tetratricopeptide repeat protein [Planctomycetes bacterium]|nr:tetratricopeptide repeat protein [Planctomycetota bacterium]